MSTLHLKTYLKLISVSHNHTNQKTKSDELGWFIFGTELILIAIEIIIIFIFILIL